MRCFPPYIRRDSGGGIRSARGLSTLGPKPGSKTFVVNSYGSEKPRPFQERPRFKPQGAVFSMKYPITRLILTLSVILLATSATSTAQPVSHVCTSATLNGAYGYLMTGQTFESSFGFVSFADSGSLTWDGKSKATGSSILNVDGQLTSRTLAGTYTVNSDCTGSLTFTDNLGSSGSINMVIIGSGVAIQLLETDSGTVISGNAKPQQTNCTAQDVSGPYGLIIRGGYFDSTGAFQAFADSGTLTSDGIGTFTLSDTDREAGNLGNRCLSGKYTIRS